ncbi:MAG: thioredoxin-disulfide reductase [Candidatus Woesearchaeota archaeon]
MKEVIILGAGIAGLTAAIYTARANLSPLVIAGPQDGGQLTLTTEVDNFPGFSQGIMGPELVLESKKQAQRFGAEFVEGWVTKVEKKNDGTFTIHMHDKSIHESKSIIVATGASARWLNIPSEEAYKGRGVTTCATCDGFFYKDKEVVVVGGGDSAMEEATFLTKFATKVTVLHRRDELRASKIMQDRFFANPKTDIIWNVVIDEVLGDGQKVTGVKLKNTQSGEVTEFKTDGVFLAVGHIPNTQMVKELISVDDHGYIKADKFMHTSVSGVFAAGDVQDTRFRQAITAAGSGCMAAMEVEKYLEGLE